MKPADASPWPAQCLYPEKRGYQAADLDREHDHVVVQGPRIEFEECIDNRTLVEGVLFFR